LVSGFFSRLQDRYNVNTVPTVVRLTQKLEKGALPNDVSYPFCPLCLGVRDQVNNLLEVGSIIKSVNIKQNEDGTTTDIPEYYESESDWLHSDIELAFCFGCKRLAISCVDKE
jgi:hypothetical protein